MFDVGIRRCITGVCGLAAGAGVAVMISACGHQLQLQGQQLGVSEMEYRLRPSQITAPSGDLTVSVHNYGRLTHDLVVISPHARTRVVSTPAGEQTQTTTVAAHTPDLAPGTSTTLTVQLAPGRYTLASTIDDDQGQGMQGSLTVLSK